MITVHSGARLDPTPLWLTPMQDALLRNAESVIEGDYCLNGCANHRVFARCYECPCFSVPAGGYIVCDGYEDATGAVAS